MTTTVLGSIELPKGLIAKTKDPNSSGLVCYGFIRLDKIPSQGVGYFGVSQGFKAVA